MPTLRFRQEPEKFIEQAIIRFTRDNPANKRKTGRGRYWDKPLVGFASGDDPLYRQYKKVIGGFHLTPKEFFEKAFGKQKTPQPISVISWILPASEAVRKSNRKEKDVPSRLWAHARDFGEQFNVKLRDHIVSLLKKKGYQAVAPMNSPHFRRLRSPKVGLASNWSERHNAYACGLGTFSLSDGLITRKGIAMRVGSVITNLPLTPSVRPYPHPYSNCLYYFDKTCKACATRCPVGAISARGHDKDKCGAFVYGSVTAAKREEYGVALTGCGLCQTRVPCEFEIPKSIRKGLNRRAR